MSIVLTPSVLSVKAKGLRAAAQQDLRGLPSEEIGGRIGAVAAKWLEPNYAHRRRAVNETSSETGLAPAMVTAGLDAAFAELLPPRLGGPAIQDLIDAQIQPESAACPDGTGPSLVTHFLAGSIITPGLWSICLGLMGKAANLVKCSSHDRIFPFRLMESFREEDDQLGQCVDVHYWGRDDTGLTDAAIEEADVVVAFGDDESIRQLQARVEPPRRFIGHGHMVSLAVVGQDAFESEIARGLARDTAFYDQQGCLSPHVVYLIGERPNCLAFCEVLARAMAELEREWPRRKLDPIEAARIQEARGSHELKQASDPVTRSWSSGTSTAWTLLYDEDPAFEFSCLNRVLRVKRLEDPDLLDEALTPVRGRIRGVALAPGSLLDSAAISERLGSPYLCAPGHLQLPPLSYSAR